MTNVKSSSSSSSSSSTGYYCQPAVMVTDHEEEEEDFMDLEWGDSSSSNAGSFREEDTSDNDNDQVPDESFEESYDHGDDHQEESLFFDSWQQPPTNHASTPPTSSSSSSSSSSFSSPRTTNNSNNYNCNCYRFRAIQPSDRQQIQDLHEEWFPVRYQSDFYDDLVRGKMCHTGEDLYTKLVVKDDDPNVILACIVAAIVPISRLNRISRNLLLPDPHTHRRACYIMTLGTVTEYRKEGLATQLVQRCMEELVMEDPSCGALYLHVITSNQSAIRFYEQRLGFWRVQEIPDYYTIDDHHYNCFLYAKYFHGNRGHLDVFKILSWLISSVWKKVKEPLSFLVQGSVGGGRGGGGGTARLGYTHYQ